MKHIKMNDYICMSVNVPAGQEKIFLGAGASVQSHIPSAGTMVWDFKRSLYCNYNNCSIDAFRDLQSSYSQQSLQSYFDGLMGFPPCGAPNEYSFYFEKCYPTEESRRNYIAKKCDGKSPSIGYLSLGALINQGYVTTVLTTNFDSLVQFGLNTICPTQSMVTLSSSLTPALNIMDNVPVLFKLHGDFLYDRIQNTTDELKHLEQNVRDLSYGKLANSSLLVVGYSGNDESIVEWFKQGLTDPNFLSYGITWAYLQGQELSDKTKEILTDFEKTGRPVQLLEISNFDDFLYRLYMAKCHEEETIKDVSKGMPAERITFASSQRTTPFIKFNAFKCIRDLSNFQVCSADTSIKSYKELRNVINGHRIVASLCRGKLLFAADNNEQKYLQPYLLGNFDTVGLNTNYLYREDSHEMEMLYDLVISSICVDASFVRVSKRKIKNIQHATSYSDGIHIYFEAANFQIQYNNNELFLIIEPTVEIERKDGKRADDNTKKTVANSVLSRRYNAEVSNYLSMWQKSILSVNGFCFQVGELKVTFDKIAISNGGTKRNPNWPAVVAYEFNEPLMQSCLSGHVNQLQGLIEDGPYDLLFQSNKQIHLATLSHINDVDRLSNYLNELNACSADGSNEGYLKNYTGFENIYRAKLIIPSASDGLCVSYNEPLSSIASSKDFYVVLTNKIKLLLDKRNDFDVLIIHIPKEAWKLRRDVNFDLHDALKLFCANNQIKVQIIEDKSILNPQKLKIKWGLSTGLYAKANGELWSPKFYDSETAFIGLSYSVLPGGTFYVGCSQLFDSSGHGMRLIINQLNDPKIIRDNPYMTKEDAQCIIGNLLRAYYQSCPTTTLKRVVIHKTTPFIKSEIEGINLALSGIENIELIQIQEYTKWRGILFNREYTDGPARFSIKRGTTLVLDDRKMLLWTHGCIKNAELKGNLNYFKNGRGIPAPIQITRFQGKSSGDLLVNEILMLTKMNWNSGDCLYKTNPVTIDFSRTVARMAKQNAILLNQSYDFRYFM